MKLEGQVHVIRCGLLFFKWATGLGKHQHIRDKNSNKDKVVWTT